MNGNDQWEMERGHWQQKTLRVVENSWVEKPAPRLDLMATGIVIGLFIGFAIIDWIGVLT